MFTTRHMQKTAPDFYSKDKQLILGLALDDTSKRQLEAWHVQGFEEMDLTVPEYKFMDGVFQGLSQRLFKENPLILTRDQLFELYGVRRDGRGKYLSSDQNKCLRAAWALHKTHRPIFFERKTGETRFVFASTGPLITFTTVYKNPTDSETRDIFSSKVPKKEIDYFIVEVPTPIIENFESYYTSLPDKPTAMIEQYKKRTGGKMSKTDCHFISYITKQRHKQNAIKEDNLIKKLRLGAALKKRGRPSIRGMIQDLFVMAHELGLVTNWSEKPASNDRVKYEYFLSQTKLRHLDSSGKKKALEEPGERKKPKQKAIKPKAPPVEIPEVANEAAASMAEEILERATPTPLEAPIDAKVKLPAPVSSGARQGFNTGKPPRGYISIDAAVAKIEKEDTRLSYGKELGNMTLKLDGGKYPALDSAGIKYKFDKKNLYLKADTLPATLEDLKKATLDGKERRP